jgi:uncharacterized membrane protein YedE/YeeE
VRERWQAFRNQYLVRYWPPIPTVVAAGVLSAYYFGITGTYWAVTGEFTRWGGNILQLLGQRPQTWSYYKLIGLQGLPWNRLDGWLVMGMFAGALAAALLAGNVKLRLPRSGRRVAQALVGGVLAGFGTRLAMGCNLAAFFTGIPQFSLHAWIFAVGTALGTMVGVQLALHPWLRPNLPLQPAGGAAAARRARPGRIQPALGVAVALGFVLLAALADHGQPLLAIGGLFGLGFGVLIERGQICFTSAFRDLWVTGRATMAKAIVLGMAASSLGTAAFVHAGVANRIYWADPGVLIGGVLFGIGIVLAGGCETGWMYRAMEGQVHFWIVGAGNIIGATTLAWGWGAWHIYDRLVAPWPKVDLLKVFGWGGGLGVTYALLALAYLGLVAWESRMNYRRLHEATDRAGRRLPALQEGIAHGD